MEYGASYDVQFERFAALRRGGAADSGTVIVQVVRDGNRSGIPDVLVSLDGNELRFTDADGVARFDRVAPGIHLVAVEEGSLPAHHQVVGAARAFVQVERGLMPAPVAFPVARPERRRTF
jgi:hypothetical protein